MAIGNNQVAVSLNSSGDHTVVAAQSGKSIQVLRAVLTLSEESTVQFKSGSNNLSGPMTCTSLMFTDETGSPWFVTNVSEALVIDIGTSVVCGGFLLVQYV